MYSLNSIGTQCDQLAQRVMLSSRNNGGESAKVCKVIIDIESCAGTRKKVIPVVSSAVAAVAQVV